ncbi:hypothetical protein SAMN04489765_0075 [Tsukamurella pulmonis]|uniref:HicB family protein n=1 Tax=Tsukamurella pulmonis TaxID=47312 RepID=A0A1H1A6I7_9ACTN|nr:hypothetical protein [Tsukamurella pulmonis]SDQ35277.1 hypothetical protein SAMN04489765_0075 [Tsukamurella pulmonis]SUQ39463.1 Uncharacterised protein [Tsukamurella pulmonis]
MTASKGERKAKLWRASPDLLDYATQRAKDEGTNLNEWLCLLVEAVRDGTVVMPQNQAMLFAGDRAKHREVLRTAS